MSPLRQPVLIASLAAALPSLVSGCAIPHGSFARPVEPVGKGGAMISVGGLVPFAAAGGASSEGVNFAEVTDGFVLVPAGAFDYAIGDRDYLGVEVSVLNTLTTSSPTDSTTFGVFVNPRWETSLSDHFSFTIDGNIGYFQSGDGNGNTTSVPFFTPAFGVRGYLPTGFGGLVWSQQISTAFITLALPGSLAYDVPIPLGGPILHLFPEFRYDPTFVFTSEASGGVALFSAGMTVMLEL